MNKPTAKHWMTPLCSAALLAAACLPTSRAATPVEADWVLAKIARPAPMRTQFVEIRGSSYLKTPQRLYGEYSRPDDRSLVRKVVAPYAETTTLQGSTATIVRGKTTRSFSLARVPELANLQSSFGAMLRGDQAALKRDFRITSTGTREQWTLVLAPRNAAVAKQVADITLRGRGAELRCIETHTRGNPQVQRTLLASAAAAVKAQTSEARLTALCQGQ